MIKSGIYFITNLINNKTYVGSINLAKREKRHFCELKNNKHYNSHLQLAWNKYGPDAFKFEIAEEVPNNQLLEVENQYLQLAKLFPELYYNQAYNSVSPMLGKKVSLETKEK